MSKTYAALLLASIILVVVLASIAGLFWQAGHNSLALIEMGANSDLNTP